MLRLAPERDLDHLLQTPGAFTWWYLDTVDAAGNGVVCIWSWGLPFLPDLRADDMPASRPSLNLAVYERGRCTFYLLQELRPEEASRARVGADGETWSFGPTRFESTRRGGRRHVRADLDLPVPGSTSRLRGSIVLEGAVPVLPELGDARLPALHVWTPLCAPARAQVELDTDDGAFRFHSEGRGYHDRNQSRVPLDALGIADWTWGRVAEPDAEVVHYLLTPTDPNLPAVTLFLRLNEDGSVVASDQPKVTTRAPRRDLYGVRWPERVKLVDDTVGGADLHLAAPVERGPFYLRHALRDAITGAQGWAERVVPGRVGVAWQQPFVRMRVHTHGSNSTWLPLFAGPASGRLGRLLAPAKPRQNLVRETRPAWALALARVYCRWRCRRDLDGVYVGGLARLRGEVARRPVILAPNHVAWWDVLVLLLLDAALGADLRCLMRADNLRKLPFLGALGAIPLRKGAEAEDDLAAAAAWLDRPGRVLVIFPQGRQQPPHVRPVAFRRGVERLATMAGAVVVPAAWTYGFREAERPTAAIMLGEAGSGEVGRLEDAVAALHAPLDDLLMGAPPTRLGLHALVAPRGGRTDDGVGTRLLAWMLGRSDHPRRQT